MLHHAAASVSFCGYNTALDLLQTSCPAVVVPFDAGGEVEKGIRSQSLAQQSGFEVLRAADLSPQALLNAIETAINDNLTDRLVPQSNGADRAVEIVTRITSERHAS
jgi:predicted glycosyltransferase